MTAEGPVYPVKVSPGRILKTISEANEEKSMLASLDDADPNDALTGDDPARLVRCVCML
jgi:hypothetical protein